MILNNIILKKIFIVITLLLFNCCTKDSRYEYLVKPRDISFISETALICNGRTWQYNRKFNVKLDLTFLYLSFPGGENDSYGIFTSPGENNETPILITKKNYLVFEFDTNSSEKIIFHSEIVTNEFKSWRYNRDGLDKNKLLIPLPLEGKSINTIWLYFTGAKTEIKIKSIYLQ